MERRVAQEIGGAGSWLGAEALRAAETYSAAIEQYRAALKREGGFSLEEACDLRIRLADCLHATADYEGAREALLPLMDEDLADQQRAQTIARIGWADLFRGDIDSCRAKCEEAAALLMPTDLHDDLALTLRWLGHAYRASGNNRATLGCFRDGLAAARRGRDKAQLAKCLNAVGMASRMQGLHEEALACHEESRAINEARGSRTHAAVSQLQLALAHLYSGDWPAAEQSLAAAERAFAELAYPRGRVDAALTRCRLLRRRGDPKEAETAAKQALTEAEKIGYRRGVVLAQEELGDQAAESSDFKVARPYFAKALRSAREIAAEGDLVYELTWRMARVELAAGDFDRADRLAWEAVKLAGKAADRRELGHALATLALVRAAQEDPVEARELGGRAVDELRMIRTPYELAVTHELIAELVDRLPDGTPAEILGHLFEARRLYGRIGAERAATRVEAGIRLLQPDPVGVQDSTPTSLVARDPGMIAVVETARELGSVDATILLEGETGTGKELIARTVHEAGDRRDLPFVAVNCAAFPSHLLESELFGHRRGAFTGADQDREGVFASADGGTILLDEIDKASLDFQSKLLRVIEDRRIRPVGTNETVELKARVLCAANRDLRELAERGTFLPDLFYRLARFRLRLPPLRDRRSDIPLLVRHFLDGCVGRLVPGPVAISSEAMERLAASDWPGNVRELRNAVESCAFFARKTGRIELHHLPDEIRDPRPRSGDDSLAAEIEELERKRLRTALLGAKGVKAQAARTLGISVKGLRDRLRRLGMSEDPAEYGGS